MRYKYNIQYYGGNDHKNLKQKQVNVVIFAK